MTARCDPSPSLVLAALVLMQLACSAVLADEFRCDGEGTLVVADDPRDARLACEGAAAAIDFLRGQGLDVAADIRIEILPALSRHDRCGAAGFFDAASRTAVLLSLVEFRRFERWLRVPVSDGLYRGLAVHEVAHLLACHNFRISKPTIQAQEYIAYVTTLATLDPLERELVLSKFPGDGYETEQQMNTTIYLCDPMRFGVEAYRHFLKKGRDAGYFDAILAGRVLAE